MSHEQSRIRFWHDGTSARYRIIIIIIIIIIIMMMMMMMMMMMIMITLFDSKSLLAGHRYSANRGDYL